MKIERYLIDIGNSGKSLLPLSISFLINKIIILGSKNGV